MAVPSYDEYSARARQKYPNLTDQQIQEGYTARYGREGVRTAGPTFEQYSARAREKYPDLTDQQIQEGYAARYGQGPGLLTDLGRAARRGFGQFGEFVGTGLEMLGAEDLGGSVADYWSQAQQNAAQSLASQNRAWYNPAAIAENVVEAGVSMLPSLGIGGGVGLGARALGAGARLAGGLGTAAGTVTGGAQEALPFYQQLVEAGDPQAAEKAAAFGAYVATVGALPTARILGRTPGRLMTGAQEAVTEISEEPVQALLAGEDPLAATMRGAQEVGPAAFLLGAALGAGPMRQPRMARDAEEFRRQAGLGEEGVQAEAPTPDQPVAVDRAGPEPMRDLTAQIQEVGKSRRGVYLSPQQGAFETPPGLASVPTPDGGRMLVREEEAAQAAADLANVDEAGRQRVIGSYTGSGVGKPLTEDSVVVQAVKNGAVVRETVVPRAEGEATQKAMQRQLKTETRIVTPDEAIARRQRIIDNEDQSPFMALGEEELLRREDTKKYLKKYIDTRALPRRDQLPRDTNAYFEPSPNSTLVSINDLTRTKQDSASNTTAGIKRMAAAAAGEISKRGPITVRSDGMGNLKVVDGNSSLAASRYVGLDQVPAEIQLETTKPEFAELEKQLAPEAKAGLAALARDAQAFMPQFEASLEGIAETVTGTRRSENLGIGARVAPIKTAGSSKWNRVVEKIVQEEGGNWQSLKDMARATIIVENQQQAQQALDMLLSTFGQAPGTNLRRGLLDVQNFDDVIRGDPYGYTDVKVNVRGPNNRVYEVQISTPALQLAKEGDGHKVYERGRKIEADAAAALRKVIQRRLGAGASTGQIKAALDRALDLFKKFDPKMQKIYADSRKVYLPAFEEFFRSSSATTRALSSSNAASEISLPSAQIEEGGTASNIPSGITLSAMGPATIAGIPSTSKNLYSTSLTSTPNVAEQVSQSNIVEPPDTRTISVPGSNIRFRAAPRVVELESLITSDLPAYDQRFQPRNRDQRVALKEQSRNIAANLDPNQLMPGRTTGDGSPIVGPTGMVESGNGRVMALRIAAQQFPENYQAYRDFLAAEGYDVAGFEAPVLILDRLTPMSDDQIIAYTAGANRRVQAAMSSTELAKADARLIDEGILTQLNSGDMSQAQNIQAISQFFAKLPTAELNDLVDKTGKPNEAGQQRAEAAMVAKALGNAEGIDSLLERLYETQDEGVRTLTNAIRLAAFRLADLRLGIETGRVPAEYDIAQDLVNAYNQVREGRRKNLGGLDIISQQDLTASPNQTALLKMFYKPDGKLHTQDTIGSELIYYATQASQQRLDQGGLFDEVVLVPPDSILESAANLIADPQPSVSPSKAAASRAFTERVTPAPRAVMEPRTRESQAKFPQRRGAMQSFGVKLIVDEVMDSWSLDSAPRVLIVQDAGELPTHVLAELGPGINGATDLNNGTIYLVANNIADQAEARRVFLHEAVGHYGFGQLYGERFPKMVDDILRLEDRDGTVKRIARGIRTRYVDTQGNFNLDRPTFAAEIVAHLAENQPKHPFARRVIAQFREILRGLGFKINLSKNDLVYLLRRSADAMAERNMGVRTARSVNPIRASRRDERSRDYSQLLPKYQAQMKKIDADLDALVENFLNVHGRVNENLSKENPQDLRLDEVPEYRQAQELMFRARYERRRMLDNFRRWTQRENTYRARKERELQGPATDRFGRPLNEAGLAVDQEGRIIPEGQEELFNEPPPPAEAPALELEQPQGQVGRPSQQIMGQRGLFASRGYRGKAYRVEGGFEGGAPSGATALDVLNNEIERGNVDEETVTPELQRELANLPAERLAWVGRTKKGLMEAYGPRSEWGGLFDSASQISDVSRYVQGSRVLVENDDGALLLLPGGPRLFASRPAQGELLGDRPAAVNRPLEVGGGTYNLNQFGRLSQAELNVLDSVIGELDAPVEAQRRGTQPWTATERAALDMIQNQYGVTIDSLVNRRPGSAANAEQLEAYGILIANTSQRIKTLADSIGRNPSSEQLAELADLKERLGMLLAPALGYQTEAGRSLNILRKMSGELKNADDIMAALGDGSENALKDFVTRVQEADSLDQVIGVTRAAYTPTWWDKFYEYWINGILSGPTTHTVNMVSNALFIGLELSAEALASVASKDVSSRAVAARVAAIPHGIMLGLKNGKTAFVEERAILTPEDKLEESRKAIGGTLGKVIRLPGRALQAEDEFFKAIAYQGELSALAMEEAIRNNPADVQAEFARIMGQVAARPDLIKAAKKKAAQVTFTTPMGPNVAAIARVLNKTKVGRLIVPFIRTPTNILLEATRYTPAAFALSQVRKDLSNGGRDAALGWSRMAVGSSVMMGIAALAAQGILSGAGPDDPNQRAQLMRQGWRPYSIKLPNGSWVRYNRFEPFGMLMGVSADLTEIGMTMKEGDYSKVASMLMTSVATNLGDKTFLSGLTDFAQAYSDPQRYLESWANRLAASPVPNIVGQTTRWLDPYQREANTIIDQYKARIPGLSQQLAERLDIAGEPITRDTGIPGNPFQVSEPKEDALAKAMLELGVRKGAPGRSLTIRGQQYKLEGDTYRGYKEFIQKSRYNVLTPIVRSPQFQAMQQQNPQMAAYYLEKYWEDIGRDAKMAWLYRNAGSLGEPVQAPAGLDLAGTYNLWP